MRRRGRSISTGGRRRSTTSTGGSRAIRRGCRGRRQVWCRSCRAIWSLGRRRFRKRRWRLRQSRLPRSMRSLRPKLVSKGDGAERSRLFFPSLPFPFVLSRDRVASQKRIEGSYRSMSSARQLVLRYAASISSAATQYERIVGSASPRRVSHEHLSEERTQPNHHPGGGRGGAERRRCVRPYPRHAQPSDFAHQQLVDPPAVEVDDLELPALLDEALALARQVAEHRQCEARDRRVIPVLG